MAFDDNATNDAEKNTDVKQHENTDINNVENTNTTKILEINTKKNINTDLVCITYLLAYYGISLKIEELIQKYSIEDQIDKVTILKILKDNSIEAKYKKISYSKLQKLKIPIITQLKSGEFVIIVEADNNKVLILNSKDDTQVIPKKDFISQWSKEIFYINPKENKRDSAKIKNINEHPTRKNGVIGKLSRDKIAELMNRPRIDTGLFCTINAAAYHGILLNPQQIIHKYTITEKINKITILKILKDASIKVKYTRVSFRKLKRLPAPIIAELKDEEYLIVAKIEKDKVLILDATDGTKVITKREFLSTWSRKIILTKSKNKIAKEFKFGISWFVPTIFKYRKALFEVILASFVVQILGIISPLITQVVIDKVLVHNSLTTLDVLAIALIGIALFETLLGISKGYVFQNTVNKIDVILGSKLFKHLFSLPLMYFESRRVGDTIAKVRELENIRSFLTGPPLNSFIDVCFIFVYIFVMVFYSRELTVAVLASLPFFVILSIIVTPIFKGRLDEKFTAGAENQSFLVESVSGVQTVKSFALEPSIQKKWESNLAGYVKAGYKTSILANNANTLSQLFSKVSDIVVLWYGARLVIDGSLTIGQLIAFRMLSSKVSGPVLRLVSLWQEFQQTKLSIKRIGDIFNSRPEPTTESVKTRMPQIVGEIKFDKVRFRYRPDAPEVIRDMSFTIRPGIVVGVVGRSGSGKSTLSKLIQRLYIPEAGRISIDGMDISLSDPAWLRTQIGVVLQENFLFTGTVRENIAINMPTAPMEEIIRVAKIAGAHEFILELTKGYDTLVGEKGTGLSGGQKQRIAIARALLSNPRILIFDEATSALDYESESMIQRNLKDICRGRTVLIIAHRLSTLKDADFIMSLDAGKLIEYAPQAELLKRKGLYRYLYDQQGGGVAINA